MGDFDFNSYDGGSALDASSYIQTTLDGGAVSASVDASASTSWIQDALGYGAKAVSFTSGVLGVLGIGPQTTGGAGAAGGASTSQMVNQPTPTQVGQGGTGATPWALYALLAGVALFLAWLLLG